LVQQCSRDAPAIQGAWVPSEKDIKELEGNLHKLIAMEATGCCGRGKLENKPSEYYRQYVGIVVEGEKLIYINAVSNGWRQSKYAPQLVCDGGKSFWGALYDPKKKQFRSLAFNGQA
jgi:hypothetical protein